MVNQQTRLIIDYDAPTSVYNFEEPERYAELTEADILYLTMYKKLIEEA